MFVLKKIIAAFLMPVPIGLFLLLLALVFLLKNSYKKAKIFLFLSFLWFALISNQTISNMIISPLENAHQSLKDTPKDIEYILVLGNGHKTNENFAITSELNTTAINRLIEGIRHYKNLKNNESNVKLIVSGKKLILVTTASHMKRASMLFKKEGLDIIESPTNHKYFTSTYPSSYFSGTNIKKVELAFHEYLGLLYSYLRREI